MARRSISSSPVEVVIPASDGILESLGYEVQTLGEKALGLTLEKKAKRSLVSFPLLKKTLWIEEDEFLSLTAASALENPALNSFQKYFMGDFQPDWPLVFLIRHIFYRFDSALLLSIDGGEFFELFEEDLSELSRHGLENPEAFRDTEVIRVSMGLRDLYMSELEHIKKDLGDRLVFSRFLPAGLSKIEWQLYLKL